MGKTHTFKSSSQHAPVIIIALDPSGRAAMTRDMELIRRILREIQNSKDVDYKPIEIPDVDPIIVVRHMELLKEARLIESLESRPLQGGVKIMVKDLTWAGHDFVAAIDNDTVWHKIKEKLSPKELATLPLSAVKTLSLHLLDQYLKLKFGLS
jgi:Hypothetical protein (DUF2513)